MKNLNFINRIFLLLFFICLSCSEKRNSSSNSNIRIELNTKNPELLNIKINKIIRLDTANNSLIGWVAKAKYFNNCYYILDNLRSKSFFIFDDKGALVFKTTRGKGPGEVVDPFAFDISLDKTNILLYDQGRASFNYFDLTGNFISSQAYPDVFIKDFCQIGQDSFLVYNSRNDPNAVKTLRFLTYTIYTNNFKKEKYLDIFVSANKISMDLIHPIEKHGEDLLFVAPWHYSVYTLKEGQESIAYNLDFGKYGLTTSELELSSEMVYEILKPGKKVGNIYSIFKSPDFLVFHCQAYPKTKTFFKLLKSNKVYCLNDCFKAGLLPFCKIWGINDDGQFYGLIEPEDLISFQKGNNNFNYLHVDENDNPFVITFNVTQIP